MKAELRSLLGISFIEQKLFHLGRELEDEVNLQPLAEGPSPPPFGALPAAPRPHARQGAPRRALQRPLPPLF